MIVYLPEWTDPPSNLCNICAYPIPKQDLFFRDREEKDICMSCYQDMCVEEGDTEV